MRKTIEKQVSATYRSLRVTVAILAFLLPPLLWLGGHTFSMTLRPSMSDYYWASAAVQSPPCERPQVPTTEQAKAAVLVDIPAGSMRNYFVGFLFAVGAMLFCYKGYTEKENWALNFAGLMAWGVAMFPMNWTCSHPKFDKHGACAFAFFVAIAYVSFFRSKDTLCLVPAGPKRNFYSVAYTCLAIAMVILPASAWWLDVEQHRGTAIYWAEFWAIYAFAAYWVVKYFEIQSIGSERRAVEHEPIIPTIHPNLP